jgi:flagellar export protein FliJ
LARSFQFRLEAVRRVRRESERVQQRILAQALRELLELDREDLQVQREIGRIREEVKAVSQQPELDVLRLRQWELYRGRLAGNLEKIEAKRKDANGRVDVERGKLLEAVKKRRAIDRLFEKQWSRHQDEMRREERRMTDELANVGFLGRQSEATRGIGA